MPMSPTVHAMCLYSPFLTCFVCMHRFQNDYSFLDVQIPVIDPCVNVTCYNGGSCTNTTNNTAICACPSTATGPLCQFALNNLENWGPCSAICQGDLDGVQVANTT